MLLVGNLFSLIAVICLAVSVVKKNKKGVIGWQIVDVIFCILSNLALSTYSAFSTNFLALIRNILAYKNKLSSMLTVLLFVLCIVIGVAVNNRGIVGWFPILASSSYTLFMYLAKNDQHMRYALVSNLLLWLVHDAYVQAYPSALADFVLSSWTLYQVYKNRS